MEHVKRLVLVSEHMADTPKKALVPPLTAQVNQLDSEMNSLLKRQDMTQDEKVKLYDQTLQRYLTYYDKRMQKPVRVSMVHPEPVETEEIEEELPEESEPPGEIENDILESVPATMKSRALQLVKKLKANKDVVGWNDHGQMVFEGRTIPGTNVIDLVNDTLRQRKNFNPAGWQLFAKALGRLNVPEGIIRNEERLNMVKTYRNKPSSPDIPLTSSQLPMATRRVKTRRARKNPYKWQT